MPADDTFLAQLRRTVERLRSWADAYADVAHIEQTDGDGFWRLKCEPMADSACPFELILHHDRHFDLAVGPEVYERLPMDDHDRIPLLAEAIAEGRAVTRIWSSRNTGAVRSVETLIRLADGTLWRRERMNVPLAAVIDAADCEADDRPYAPYRLH